MSPVQVAVLAINDALVPYAETVKTKLEKAGLRVELDKRTESLNKKIRAAQLNQTPLILTIGAKEKESGNLSVRTLDGNVRLDITHEEFINTVLEHIRTKSLDLKIFST